MRIRTPPPARRSKTTSRVDERRSRRVRHDEVEGPAAPSARSGGGCGSATAGTSTELAGRRSRGRRQARQRGWHTAARTEAVARGAARRHPRRAARRRGSERRAREGRRAARGGGRSGSAVGRQGRLQRRDGGGERGARQGRATARGGGRGDVTSATVVLPRRLRDRLQERSSPRRPHQWCRTAGGAVGRQRRLQRRDGGGERGARQGRATARGGGRGGAVGGQRRLQRRDGGGERGARQGHAPQPCTLVRR
jgi:hypothetical protein